jgi:hypothetical protein
MKTRLYIALAALTALLAVPTLAHASDLSQDLKTPFEALSNPFDGVQEKKLDNHQAKVLKTLLSRCAFVPTWKTDDGYPATEDARLKAECRHLMTPVFAGGSQSKYMAQIRIHGAGLRLTAVAWDGSDSDGGDQFALGIYDAAGTRIAVYPSLYMYGNVIDALSYAIDMDLPKVEKSEVRH